jgi:predicted AAA+ superfamily ATPase
VGLELLRRTGSVWPEARLHHFRTRSGLEVDYLLEVGRELWGIEVKASDSVNRQDFRGLTGLGAHSNRIKRRLVIYLGRSAEIFEGIEVLPVGDFLATLPR